MPHGQIAEDKTRLCVILPKQLKQDLQVIAEKENRSLNNLISVILTNYRGNVGYLYPDLSHGKR